MRGIFIRWLILTTAIIIASYVLDGIKVSGFFSAFFAAAILGILNAFFRPILFILTLPLNIMTLGLFTFVINAILLKMATGVIPGFEVHGFWTAVFGSLLISVVSWILTSFINERGTVEYIELRKRAMEGGNKRKTGQLLKPHDPLPVSLDADPTSRHPPVVPYPFDGNITGLLSRSPEGNRNIAGGFNHR